MYVHHINHFSIALNFNKFSFTTSPENKNVKSNRQSKMMRLLYNYKANETICKLETKAHIFIMQELFTLNN